MMRNRMSGVARTLRRVTRPWSNLRRKMYGQGARGLGKNKYTYDPKTGDFVPLHPDEEEEEDIDEYLEPNVDLQEVTSKTYVPPPPGPDHVPDFIDLDDISPEFGAMFFQPAAKPQHSFIQEEESRVSGTIIISKKKGHIKDLPEDGALPLRTMSDPTIQGRRGSMKPLEDYRKATRTSVKGGNDHPAPKKVSIATQITPSLQRLSPPQRPSIPIPVEPPPPPAQAKAKKAISWGEWTLLEFVRGNDNYLADNQYANRRSASEPNIAVENLAKCPEKSNLRKSQS